MEAAGPDLIGEGDDVARARDVGALGLLRRRREVVHGSEVEELGAAQLLAVVHRECEAGLRQVAGECVEAFPTRVEALTLRRIPGPRPGADEHEDVVATGEEQRHQVAADESRRACDEVRHAADNSFL